MTALLRKRESSCLQTGERSANGALDRDCPSLAEAELLTHRLPGVLDFVRSGNAASASVGARSLRNAQVRGAGPLARRRLAPPGREVALSRRSASKPQNQRKHESDRASAERRGAPDWPTERFPRHPVDDSRLRL